MIFIERIKSLIVVLTASFYQIKLLDYSVGDTIIFGAEFYKRGTANLAYRSLCKFYVLSTASSRSFTLHVIFEYIYILKHKNIGNMFKRFWYI